MPFHREDTSIFEPELKRSPEEPGRRPVVVCVDDDPAVLAALSRLFRALPFEFRTTVSPREAVKWITHRDVDVLISDQRMPSITGTQLLAIVSERSPATRLILLTAYPDADLFQECARHHARRLILKPWDDAALRWTIAEMLG